MLELEHKVFQETLKGVEGLGILGVFKAISAVIKYRGDKKAKEEEADISKEKEIDGKLALLLTTMGSELKRQGETIEKNTAAIDVKSKYHEDAIDKINVRLDEEVEKRKFAEINCDVQLVRAEEAELALGRARAEYSILQIELVAAKRQVSESNALSDSRQSRINELMFQVAELEKAIKTLERFVSDHGLKPGSNITMPVVPENGAAITREREKALCL